MVKRRSILKKTIIKNQANPQSSLQFVEGDIQRLIQNLQNYIQILIEKIRAGEETNRVLQDVVVTVEMWRDAHTVQSCIDPSFGTPTLSNCLCQICTIMNEIK